jgi:hypothetical protein
MDRRTGKLKKLNIQFLTVNYNNLRGLKVTTESVLIFSESLKDKNTTVNWLIKDANSTDGSQEFINELLIQKTNSTLKIDVEISKDTGIFNGMNRAITLAMDGVLTLFLNSGDYLSNEFIKKFEPSQFNNCDLVYGNYYTNQEVNKFLVKLDPNLDFEFVLNKMVNHQSLFINSSLLKKNPFKEDFWVNADWVQLFDIMRTSSLTIKYLNYAIPVYELGGNSDKFYQEGLNQREEYLNRCYSPREVEALKKVGRLRQRSWYSFILKALDSPIRTKILNYIAKLNKLT